VLEGQLRVTNGVAESRALSGAEKKKKKKRPKPYDGAIPETWRFLHVFRAHPEQILDMPTWNPLSRATANVAFLM